MKNVLYPKKVISEKLKKVVYKKKTFIGKDMSRRRNSIIMIRLPTSKKVVLSVGKMFIANATIKRRYEKQPGEEDREGVVFKRVGEK